LRPWQPILFCFSAWLIAGGLIKMIKTDDLTAPQKRNAIILSAILVLQSVQWVNPEISLVRSASPA
jgi:hypothetical protein